MSLFHVIGIWNIYTQNLLLNSTWREKVAVVEEEKEVFYAVYLFFYCISVRTCISDNIKVYTTRGGKMKRFFSDFSFPFSFSSMFNIYFFFVRSIKAEQRRKIERDDFFLFYFVYKNFTSLFLRQYSLNLWLLIWYSWYPNIHNKIVLIKMNQKSMWI